MSAPSHASIDTQELMHADSSQDPVRVLRRMVDDLGCDIRAVIMQIAIIELQQAGTQAQ